MDLLTLLMNQMRVVEIFVAVAYAIAKISERHFEVTLQTPSIDNISVFFSLGDDHFTIECNRMYVNDEDSTQVILIRDGEGMSKPTLIPGRWSICSVQDITDFTRDFDRALVTLKATPSE